MDAKKTHPALDSLQAQIDSTGRTFYAVDDKRYPADAIGLDSAFGGNRWPGGTVYYRFLPRSRQRTAAPGGRQLICGVQLQR